MLSSRAEDSFAEGHALLVVALLTALAIMLMRSGARRLPIFEALTSGKLGRRFSLWVERHEAQMMKSERLKPRKSLGQQIKEQEERQRERRPPPKQPEEKREPKPKKQRPCDHLRGGNPQGRGPYRGGAHSHTSRPVNDGKDSHHMPADDASPLPKKDGPAIQMEPKDHADTSSNGNQGLAGKRYRKQIKGLLETGQERKAMAKEVRDVRRVAAASGNARKYNEATREMLAYFKCVEKHKAAYA